MLAQEQTQIIRIPELSKLSVYFDLSRHFYLISINTTAAKKFGQCLTITAMSLFKRLAFKKLVLYASKIKKKWADSRSWASISWPPLFQSHLLNVCYLLKLYSYEYITFVYIYFHINIISPKNDVSHCRLSLKY